MPARPQTNIEKVCAAAAVVKYIRCPDTEQLQPLPTGTSPTPGQAIQLTVNTN